jgi:hypothetical protein
MTLVKFNTQRANQRGAMFGLDARIALAIFSLLAVVAGASMVANMAENRAKGLVAELAETAKAVDGFHADLKDDIYMVLLEPSEARAFQALYDDAVIREDENHRARWNGPYIRAASNRHAEFGEISIQKRQSLHTERCDAFEGGLCFLWLVYSSVPPNVVAEANRLMDGVGEQNAQTAGRVQWSQEEDTRQILYYRLSKALRVE